MLNDKRFIKFKSEKQRDSIKLKDNEINVLFYSEKNILLSENFNSQKDLLNLFKKIIYDDTSNTILVRSEKGNFLLVKRKTLDKDLTYKYLEELGGRIYNKIKNSKRPAPLLIINFIVLKDWLNQIIPTKTKVEIRTLLNVSRKIYQVKIIRAFLKIYIEFF